MGGRRVNDSTRRTGDRRGSIHATGNQANDARASPHRACATGGRRRFSRRPPNGTRVPRSSGHTLPALGNTPDVASRRSVGWAELSSRLRGKVRVDAPMNPLLGSDPGRIHGIVNAWTTGAGCRIADPIARTVLVAIALRRPAGTTEPLGPAHEMSRTYACGTWRVSLHTQSDPESRPCSSRLPCHGLRRLLRLTRPEKARSMPGLNPTFYRAHREKHRRPRRQMAGDTCSPILGPA